MTPPPYHFTKRTYLYGWSYSFEFEQPFAFTAVQKLALNIHVKDTKSYGIVRAVVVDAAKNAITLSEEFPLDPVMADQKIDSVRWIIDGGDHAQEMIGISMLVVTKSAAGEISH